MARVGPVVVTGLTMRDRRRQSLKSAWRGVGDACDDGRRRPARPGPAPRPSLAEPTQQEDRMDLIEVTEEQRLRREEVADRLRRLADELARHNEVPFTREGVRYS